MRKDLEKQFGEEYADFLQLIGSIRKKILSKKHAPEIHKHLFEQLISRDLIHMIRNHQKEKINSLLFEIFGEGYEYDLLIKYNT